MNTDEKQQRVSFDENASMTAHDHDCSRSSAKPVPKHHYGLGSVKVTFNSNQLKLTRTDDGQTREPDRFVSSTQTRWHPVKESTYASYSNLRAKGFESSTLLATPRPGDSVPQVAQRVFDGDSHCGREPQKRLESHPAPSQYYYHPHYNERNTNVAMMSSSSFASSTPRSRSIKIERTKRSEPDFEADTIDRNKSLYDSATWRMYNRITEYRRQHPINYDDLDMGCTGSSSIQHKFPMFLPRKESSALYGPRALNRVLMSVGPVTSREQHKLDGEVFDMDL